MSICSKCNKDISIHDEVYDGLCDKCRVSPWQKFKKKPIEIRAIQLTEGIYKQVADKEINIEGLELADPQTGYKLTIHYAFKTNTLEGTMYGDINDWYVEGVKGEHYFCKSDIFEMTYEVVK